MIRLIFAEVSVGHVLRSFLLNKFLLHSLRVVPFKLGAGASEHLMVRVKLEGKASHKAGQEATDGKFSRRDPT